MIKLPKPRFKFDETPAENQVLPEGVTPLDYLLGVMRGTFEYNSHQFRCAVAALPFIHPKLGVSLNVSGEVKDFAELLRERRELRRLTTSRANVVNHEPLAEPIDHNAPFPKLNRRF
jgi:hypothetical protein